MKHQYSIRITLDINMSGASEDDAIKKAIEHINDRGIDLYISDVYADIDYCEDEFDEEEVSE